MCLSIIVVDAWICGSIVSLVVCSSKGDMIKMARRSQRNMTVVLTVARNLRAAATSVDVLPPHAGASFANATSPAAALAALSIDRLAIA